LAPAHSRLWRSRCQHYGGEDDDNEEDVSAAAAVAAGGGAKLDVSKQAGGRNSKRDSKVLSPEERAARDEKARKKSADPSPRIVVVGVGSHYCHGELSLVRALIAVITGCAAG